MITIPIWLFVLLIILAIPTTLIVLSLVEKDPDDECFNDCSYQLEDDPDYDPEHIPLERNK